MDGRDKARIYVLVDPYIAWCERYEKEKLAERWKMG
jgi:hypothetical protein